QDVGAKANLIEGFGIHEVIAFGIAIEVFKFDIIEDRALDGILSAEAVVDDGPAAQAAHLGGHGATLISRRAMIDAVDGVQVPFMQNNHSWTQLRRLHQALLSA